MKLYKVEHSGVYMTAVSIVFADSRKQVVELMREGKHGEVFRIEEINPPKPGVYTLFDGDY